MSRKEGEQKSMEFPAWFQDAIQGRLDYILAKIERHPNIQKLRDEKQAAFRKLELDMNERQKSNFLDWEEKQTLALAVKAVGSVHTRIKRRRTTGIRVARPGLRRQF
ncbi:hypothetical protein [Paenibacillus antibioticophila]|uniref:hypothetical protein n=1 Tax=Paenibacillus antibioticophila TaxID=1274374 RepID=UPI0005CABF10|nr:hypothetical protein [Paenibacillus antibioticophila]